MPERTTISLLDSELSLEKLKHEAVLDGEVVALDEQGHSRFAWLFSRNGQRKGRLVYYIFDLLFLDGQDLRSLPLYMSTISKSTARNFTALRQSGDWKGLSPRTSKVPM